MLTSKLIITGQRVYSPVKQRRRAIILNFNNFFDQFEKWFLRNPNIPKLDFNYEDYVKSFCKYCSEEKMCWRHRSIEDFLDLVFRVSNSIDVYTIYHQDLYLTLSINIGNWEAELKMGYYYPFNIELVLKRPSATFRYKNHSEKSTVNYFVNELINRYVEFRESLRNNYGKVDLIDIDDVLLDTIFSSFKR